MTCIVGVVKGNAVYLGGDRAATDGELNRTILKEPKLAVLGEVGFGICGSPKILNALKSGVQLPTQGKGDAREFLMGQVVPAITELFKKMDCTVDHPEHGPVFQGAMLVAYRGMLFTMQSNFQMIESDSGYASVGSGSKLALGSLASTKKLDARKRVLTALEASTGNAGCAAPFDVVVIKKRLF